MAGELGPFRLPRPTAAPLRYAISLRPAERRVGELTYAAQPRLPLNMPGPTETNMHDDRAIGIPNIDLAGRHGGAVNPVDFAGHGLVMLFCAAEEKAAAAELAAYEGLANTLSHNDAYIVAICGAGAGPLASRMFISNDIERAWDAVGKCLNGANSRAPDDGAVLLFGRGGCLTKVWRGIGHADEVAQAIGERR